MSQFKRENKRSGVFTRRALLLGAGELGVLGVLGAKLYQVQVVEGDRYATLAESNRISAAADRAPAGPHPRSLRHRRRRQQAELARAADRRADG